MDADRTVQESGHSDCRSPCPTRSSSPPRGRKVQLTSGVAFLGRVRRHHANT